MAVAVVAAVIAAVAVSRVREERAVALKAVDDIESQLAALDPVTRADVIARLAADLAKQVKDLKS